ncbi:hypothetical protein ACFL9U_17220, partial [Thermodesulfobacteriota bacterium]
MIRILLIVVYIIFSTVAGGLSAEPVDIKRAPKSTIEFLKQNFNMFEAMSIILKSSEHSKVQQFLMSEGFRFIGSQTQGEMLVEGYSTNDVKSPIIGYSLFFLGDSGPLVIVDTSVNPLNVKAIKNSEALIHNALDSVSA